MPTGVHALTPGGHRCALLPGWPPAQGDAPSPHVLRAAACKSTLIPRTWTRGNFVRKKNMVRLALGQDSQGAGKTYLLPTAGE